MDNKERAKTLAVALGLGNTENIVEMIHLCMEQVKVDAIAECVSIAHEIGENYAVLCKLDEALAVAEARDAIRELAPKEPTSLELIQAKYEELKTAVSEWYHVQRGTMSAASPKGLAVGKLLGMSAYTGEGKRYG